MRGGGINPYAKATGRCSTGPSYFMTKDGRYAGKAGAISGVMEMMAGTPARRCSRHPHALPTSLWVVNAGAISGVMTRDGRHGEGGICAAMREQFSAALQCRLKYCTSRSCFCAA